MVYFPVSGHFNPPSLMQSVSSVVLFVSCQAFIQRTQNVSFASQPIRAGVLDMPLIVVSWPTLQLVANNIELERSKFSTPQITPLTKHITA